MASVDATEINPFVGPMLKARRNAMRAFAGLVTLTVIVAVVDKYPIVAGWAAILAVAALCTILVWGCIVTWYYLYRAAREEAGPRYAVSHLLLSVLLTFVALPVLFGVFFVPMLVCGDIERRRRASSEETA
jgi:heme/copper-type cytochrome/quinol oxidase subunit 2